MLIMYVLKISIYQRLSWLINMLMHADADYADVYDCGSKCQR